MDGHRHTIDSNQNNINIVYIISPINLDDSIHGCTIRITIKNILISQTLYLSTIYIYIKV